MGEYIIKIAEFTVKDMINNREAFDLIQGACIRLKGERVYLKSSDMWITCKGWYSKEDKLRNTVSLYLEYESEQEIDKEKGSVLDMYVMPEVPAQLIDITLEYPKEKILGSGGKECEIVKEEIENKFNKV